MLVWTGCALPGKGVAAPSHTRRSWRLADTPIKKQVSSFVSCALLQGFILKVLVSDPVIIGSINEKMSVTGVQNLLPVMCSVVDPKTNSFGSGSRSHCWLTNEKLRISGCGSVFGSCNKISILTDPDLDSDPVPQHWYQVSVPDLIIIGSTDDTAQCYIGFGGF
jgi:hypothetical protein